MISQGVLDRISCKKGASAGSYANRRAQLHGLQNAGRLILLSQGYVIALA
jgi:hypothetical protein